MTPREVVRVLEERGHRPKPEGSSWIAVCPVCLNVDEPCLAVGVWPDGDVRLTCHRGCEEHEVWTALRLEMPAAPERAPDPMPVESWSAFRDRGQGEVPMLVDRIWPVGAMGFVASAPKAGKTWLSLTLGMAVATGRPFLGVYRVPRARPVLYVAMEGTREGLRARVGCLARGMGLDPDSDALDALVFSYKPKGLNLSEPAWAERLIERAREIDAGLVVVDVLRRAASVAEDHKGASDFAALIRNLGALEAEGRALDFNHHFIKSGETTKGRKAPERMAGSGALYGALDTGLFITSSDDGARQMRVEVEARDIRAPKPFGVELHGEVATGPNGGWSYMDTVRIVVDTAEAPSSVDVMVDQLVALREKDPSITKIAAAAKLGTTRNAAVFQSAWPLAGERVRSVRAPYIGGAHAQAHTPHRDEGIIVPLRPSPSPEGVEP